MKVTDEDRKLFRHAVDNWQIVIVRPRIEYRPTILDLQGITVQSAYECAYRFIYESYIYNIKRIIIITGKSGVICMECIRWLHTEKFLRYVQRVEVMNGGGAIRITLRNFSR